MLFCTEWQVCSQYKLLAAFKGLLRSGDVELSVSENGLWPSYQVRLLKPTRAHYFRASLYSQRNGKN